MSALYLNNRKIQATKNNHLALKSMELFVDFLDNYKLQNTKEIFVSEANYSANQEAVSSLEMKLKDKKSSLAEQLLKQFKSSEKAPPKKSSEEMSFKAKMNDIQEKSAKFDQILEKKRLEFEKQSSSSFRQPSANNMDEMSFERKSKPVIVRSGNQQNEKQIFENLQIQAKISPPLPPISEKEKSVKIRELINKKESESSLRQSNFTDSNLHLKTTSNIDSKEQIEESGRDNKVKKLSIQDSSILNTDNNDEGDLITESQGFDLTVDSDALEEFDYVESVEKERF